jgi:hypothetical protein
VGSSKGLDSLAAGESGKPAAASGKPVSAADRAMEELLAFQQQQQEAARGSSGEEQEGGRDREPYFKPSPSVSGSEEHAVAAAEQTEGEWGLCCWCCGCCGRGSRRDLAVSGVHGRLLR